MKAYCAITEGEKGKEAFVRHGGEWVYLNQDALLSSEV
jgi:hypothetical protein